jgi:hypothetical protein
VFPFLRTLGGDGSTYSHHMKDARFTIPTPQLLSRVVDMLDDIPMADRDTSGGSATVTRVATNEFFPRPSAPSQTKRLGDNHLQHHPGRWYPKTVLAIRQTPWSDCWAR